MLPNDVLVVAGRLATELGLPHAHVAAVTDVESNGRVFGPDGLPMILFEPHIFYRRISGAARDEAVAIGLASKEWNKRLYPDRQAERWKQISDAIKLLRRHGLPEDAAWESASYGVGQVMGFHWKALGFRSVKGFVERMKAGAEGQIHIMLRFIAVNHLDDELREGRWAAFARGYNGKGFRKNHYDTKLARAALLYGGQAAAPDGLLRLGAKGARVRELQALLARAGHAVTVDGDFGPATRDAVMAFQKSRKLKADGVYGPKTEAALAEFRQSADEKPGAQKVTEIDAVKQGAGGVGGGLVLEGLQNRVDAATEQLQQVSGFDPWLGYGLAALSLVAFCIAAWGAYRMLSGWLKSRTTVEA